MPKIWKKPTLSPDIVAQIMRIGHISPERTSLLEAGLEGLCAEYARELDKLKYYASDKQIVDGLASVKTQSASLAEVLKRPFVREALLHTLIQTSDSSEKAECQDITDRFEADVDGVLQMIEGTAKTALEFHKRIVKDSPELGRKEPNEKPEIEALVEGLLDLWSELGRKPSDPGLVSFIVTAEEWLLRKDFISPDTVRSQLRRVRDIRDR